MDRLHGLQLLRGPWRKSADFNTLNIFMGHCIQLLKCPTSFDYDPEGQCFGSGCESLKMFLENILITSCFEGCICICISGKVHASNILITCGAADLSMGVS